MSRNSCCGGHDLYLQELCPQASAGVDLLPPTEATFFLTAFAKIAVMNAEFPQFSLLGIHTVRSPSCHRVHTPTSECCVNLLTRVLVFLARSVHVVHVVSMTPRQFPSHLQDSVQCDSDLVSLAMAPLSRDEEEEFVGASTSQKKRANDAHDRCIHVVSNNTTCSVVHDAC